MEYNWGIKDLYQAKKQLLNLLKHCKNKGQCKDIKLVLSSLQESIKDEKRVIYLDTSIIQKIGFRARRLREIDIQLQNCSKYYSLVFTFFDIISKHRSKIDSLEEQLDGVIDEDQRYIYDTSAKLSNDKAVSLVDLFYRKNLQNLYPLFIHIYEKRFDSIRFLSYMDKDTVADSTYLWFLDRYFINCIDTNDIKKYYNLIHEYGHVLQYYINPKELYKPTNEMFSEVSSLFPELVALYENDGNFDMLSVHLEQYLNLTNLLGWATNLVLHSPVINTWISNKKKLNKDFFSTIDYYYDLDNDGFHSLLETTIDDNGTYIISYMVAIELFHIYKVDKEKAFELYEKILRIPYGKDVYKTLNQMFNLGEHLEEESLEIINNLSLSLQKRKR